MSDVTAESAVTSQGDSTIAEWLETLAARTPIPGGGSASAICGAMGAALASMVLNYSQNPDRFPHLYTDSQEQQPVLLESMAAVREKLLELADDDGQAFEAVSATAKAFRKIQKSGDAQEKAAARQQYDTVLHHAINVSVSIIREVLNVLRVASRLIEEGNRGLITDTAAAALLAQAAAKISLFNILINLREATVHDSLQQLVDDVEKIIIRIDGITEDITRRTRERIEGKSSS